MKETPDVCFSVSAPAAMVPDRHYIVNAWAYGCNEHSEMVKRVSEIEQTVTGGLSYPQQVSLGSRIILRLSIQTLTVVENERVIEWHGKIANATFPIFVPADVHHGTYRGSVEICPEGLRAAQMDFVLTVAPEEAPPGRLKVQERRIRSAFVSYSSTDRKDVLARIQGMQKVFPQLDVFLDVVSLRSGERWRERLREAIEERDVFYLFWSKAASASPWVEREWRCALATKGIDSIDPVPLVDPAEVQPPAELADELHFNDWHIAYIRSCGLGSPVKKSRESRWQFWKTGS